MTRANPPDAKAPEKTGPDHARDKRRADALRANLKRRKAQLRGRAASNQDDAAPASEGPDPIKSP